MVLIDKDRLSISLDNFAKLLNLLQKLKVSVTLKKVNIYDISETVCF